MTQIKTSEKFSLNARDFAKGLGQAILVPALYILQSSLKAGLLTFNWTNIAMASVAGGVGYLIHKFLEPGATVIQQDTKPPLP